MQKVKVVPSQKKNELQTTMLDMTDKAKELEITDQVSFDITGQVLIDLASMKKKIVAYHKDAKDSTKKAKDVAYQKEKDDLAPISLADVYVRRIRIEYNTIQEKKRKKEQDRLDAMAKRKADKEKEKLLAKAETAEDPEEKEELQQKAEDVYVPANIAAGTMEKTTRHEGGARLTWIPDIDVEITDVKKICEGVSGNIYPTDVVEVKTGKLKAWAKSFDLKPGKHLGFIIIDKKRESVKT